jgi:SpoVK/Ycf46/Vps4 family AAA+-type ATPase
VARELGLDLYQIDLSTVVSKYIGETEQNLSRIFHAAEASNAILFFDEADALFGKRSEVKDARDRYANIEVAYLLQKMEEYDGVAILATNLHNNMDEAFARRLHHTVQFRQPDARMREQIWRKVFPAQTPLAPELDFVFLARQFEITGGNIRNAALSAAFLAADDGQPVTMAMIVTAVARELQKMGKIATRDVFQQYYADLQWD